MILDGVDDHLWSLIDRAMTDLALPTDRLRITTRQQTFEGWIGRRLGSTVGGAYAFIAREHAHVVLINLNRIDLSQPKALNIVVCEELIHMRDRIDGDLRRHAKHGHDRIAVRVADMAGASMDEVRSCLLPPRRRPFRYLYACPTCNLTIRRRRKGRWSCGRCAPRFDRRHVLQLVRELRAEEGAA